MSPARPSHTGAELLRALERTGPRPALAWYGEAARIELSGHVLANWVIKAIGHLHDEVALAPGDVVVLDLPVHWKRLVLALAAWSLGSEVVVLERAGTPEGDTLPDAAAEPSVVATDRPGSELAGAADEVLALEAVSLAPRWPEQLPALVRDWLVEVRGSSDQLGVDLPGWSGPLPAEDAGPGGTPGPGGDAPSEDGVAGEHSVAREDGVAAAGTAGAGPRLLVPGDGTEVAPRALAALLAGGGIVGPAERVTERQAHEEGVTGSA